MTKCAIFDFEYPTHSMSLYITQSEVDELMMIPEGCRGMRRSIVTMHALLLHPLASRLPQPLAMQATPTNTIK